MGPEGRVLYLSAPIGAGHRRAAEALLEQERLLRGETASAHADVFDFFPAFAGRWLLKAYLTSLRLAPTIYAALYRQGNRAASSAWRDYTYGLLAERLWPYIAAQQPKAVVCTHATPAGLAVQLQRRGKLRAPIFAVVTDYVVHQLWLYPEIAHYFLAHEDLAASLIARGVAPERMTCTGIPVGAAFAGATERAQAKAQLGIDPERPLLLLMGGGEGLVPVEAIVRALDVLEEPFSLMAVAGRNQSLAQRLRGMAETLRHPLLVTDFVDDVHLRMAAADLLLSKAGGVTAAEAFCRAVPLLIYRPLPGQEEANTRFLVERGGAMRVETVQEVLAAVRSLFQATPAERADRYDQLQLWGRPLAAAQVLEKVFSQMRP